MDKEIWKNIAPVIILLTLITLSFLLIKEILLSIILGIILAFIFFPIYQKINKIIPSKNFSALVVCLLSIVLIILPLWFIVPILINQSISIYLAAQSIDFVGPLVKYLPSFFKIEGLSTQIGTILYTFVTKTTNSIMNSLANVIYNLPQVFLHTLVVLFTFYFVLRDNEKFVGYVQSLIPFNKEVENKLFKSSRDITFSVLYGQIIIGIAQGLVTGIGFFIAGVNNALFLTILAALAGIFPIIGSSVVWIPVAIVLFAGGKIWPAFIVIFFGIIASFFENAIKPAFVSKRTNVHTAVVLLGMIGGIFFVGVLGIILGPLILAYLLIILEVYRDKKSPGLIHKNP